MKNSLSGYIAKYEPYYQKFVHTGSRVICTPPITDTDDDYLLLVSPDKVQDFENKLVEDGWVLGGSMPNGILPLNTEHEYKEDGSIDHSKVFHSWKTPPVMTQPEHHSDWAVEDYSKTVNLLITCNEEYFEDFCRATFLARALNLKYKPDRITLFEAITRNVWPDADTDVYTAHSFNVQPGQINYTESANLPGGHWAFIDSILQNTQFPPIPDIEPVP